MNISGKALGAVAAAVLVAGIGGGYLIAGHGSGAAAAPKTTAAAAATTTPGTVQLNGSFTLQRGAFVWQGDGDTTCTGYTGYTDIATGARVTITDQSGTVIGTGGLGYGNAQGITSDGTATSCVFAFSVTVPDDRPFYGVAVSHRGVIQFSAEQVHHGEVALTLGG